MTDIDELAALVPHFVNGTLSPERRGEFIHALVNSKELQSLLASEELLAGAIRSHFDRQKMEERFARLLRRIDAIETGGKSDARPDPKPQSRAPGETD